MTIFVVEVTMSSPDIAESSEMLDDRTKEIRLRYPQWMRQQITTVRNKHKSKIYDLTVKFFTLQLIDDDKIEEIRKIIYDADAELKGIDLNLSANVVFLPVSEEAVNEGELRQKIVYAIQSQILKEVHNRLKDIKSDEPRKRTQESIRDALESMKQLNIVNDKSIDDLIDRISRLLNRKTSEIKQEIMSDLMYIEEELKAL